MSNAMALCFRPDGSFPWNSCTLSSPSSLTVMPYITGRLAGAGNEQDLTAFGIQSIFCRAKGAWTLLFPARLLHKLIGCKNCEF
jgi:hypothetical protein